MKLAASNPASIGYTARRGIPREDFRKIMRDDAQRWAGIIRSAGIKTQ